MARILELSETELYFADKWRRGPYSPRNELLALSTLLAALSALAGNGGAALESAVAARLDSLGQSSSGAGRPQEAKPAGGAAEALVAWAAARGVESHVSPAVFEGTGRGVAASVDLPRGETAVCVPVELLLSARTALASEICC